MSSDTTLLSDQVFQLNTFLWALIDLPEDGPREPVLYRAGYRLRSIGRRVLVPEAPQARATLTELTGSTDHSPCHPDLWLRHESDPVEPIIELKAHGFSPGSSNQKQALKLIVSVANPSPSLVEPVDVEYRGHVIYATVAADSHKLSGTLKELAEELTTRNAPAASTGVIGLSMETEGVALSSPHPSDLPEPVAAVLASSAIVLRREDNNDLQPLYLIPWIPGIKDSQDAQLHSDGLRELTARVLTHALAKIGQAQTPTTLTLDSAQLLSNATFEVFEQWKDKDEGKLFSKEVVKIVERALKPEIEVQREGGHHLKVTLPDSETQESAINHLERANPANPSTNLEAGIEEPPTLFDQT